MLNRIGFIAAGVIIATNVTAADLPRKSIPATAPISNDLLFGSVYVGGNLLFAPAQSFTLDGNRFSTQSATAPFIFGGGKFTYVPSGSNIGVQLDLNAGAISSGWVNPNIGTDSRAHGIGGTAHVFTRAFNNAKVGAFFQGELTTLTAPNVSVRLPAMIGGLEGQYALSDNLLLRGRAGYGRASISTSMQELDAFKLPDFRILTGGVGLTYAIDRSWQVGTDLNYSKIDTKYFGFNGSMSVVDLGAFAQYRFESWPLSLRTSVNWLSATGQSNVSSSVTGTSYRFNVALTYEFGAAHQRPKRLLEQEFLTYTIPTGQR